MRVTLTKMKTRKRMRMMMMATHKLSTRRREILSLCKFDTNYLVACLNI
jgi:hypothetical protein